MKNIIQDINLLGINYMTSLKAKEKEKKREREGKKSQRESSLEYTLTRIQFPSSPPICSNNQEFES